MKKRTYLTILLLSLFVSLIASTASAHTLFMSVTDNEDGTITVEGMYSTGATAAATELRLEDNKGKIILKTTLDEEGEQTFKKPSVSYEIILDGGEGHLVREDGPA